MPASPGADLPARPLEAGIDQAVARIVTHRQRPSWYTPWDFLSIQQGSGSGFVVEGGLVMTNAHVISDARLLLVFLQGDPNPHQAEVHAVGHDCDLALLRLVEPEALSGRVPLPFGGLPPVRSTVETFGYPAGGREISSTRGVVSRIEMQDYTHPGNERHLAAQTDAAINPGNSGGPVVQEGKVVGVAFQAAPDLQNVGYFIPTEVVHHFRTDVARGEYRGFPGLGVRLQNMENPAARRVAGMAPGESGAAVDLVYPETSAEGHLLPGDVILAVDGQVVANDCTVLDADSGLRVDLLVLVDRHQVGDNLQLRILRQGAHVELELPLKGWRASGRHANQHDARPRYYVYGGLVFVPLDLEMLKTFGPNWRSTGDKVLLHEFLIRPYKDLDQWRKERVVLLRRLDHPVNAAMAWYQNLAIERVNGQGINGLADLIDALAVNRDPFHVFEFSSDRIAVLNRVEAERANPEILELYGVPRDRNL